ncbi:nicotinamide N-methyltransferase, partial [Sarracenia purpurea var. burkii]
MWNGILKVASESMVMEVFYENWRVGIGNGLTTRFWEDAWVGEKPLNQYFPRLFRLSLQKGATIYEIFYEILGRGSRGLRGLQLQSSARISASVYGGGGSWVVLLGLLGYGGGFCGASLLQQGNDGQLQSSACISPSVYGGGGSRVVLLGLLGYEGLLWCNSAAGLWCGLGEGWACCCYGFVGEHGLWVWVRSLLAWLLQWVC